MMQARVWFKEHSWDNPGNDERWDMHIFNEMPGRGADLSGKAMVIDSITISEVETAVRDMLDAHMVNISPQASKTGEMIIDIITGHMMSLGMIKDICYALHGRELQEMNISAFTNSCKDEPLIRYFIYSGYDDIQF